MTTESAHIILPAALGGQRIDLVSNPYPPTNAFFPLPLSNPDIQSLLFVVNWLDPHGNNVGADSVHKVKPVLNPRPGLGPFDTIVRRLTDANISTGVGQKDQVDLQISWLSLKSSVPSDYLGIGFSQNVYVGLNESVTQVHGRMELTSTVSDGTQGMVNIGKMGETTNDPSSPSFLGLPVDFKIFFVPVFLTQDPANAILTVTDQAIFHGETIANSGYYQVVPEPGTLMVGGVCLAALLGTAARRRIRGRLGDAQLVPRCPRLVPPV